MLQQNNKANMAKTTPVTRAASPDKVFEHILNDVIALPNTGVQPIRLLLQQHEINTLPDLLGLDPEILATMSYTPPSVPIKAGKEGETTPGIVPGPQRLTPVHIHKIRLFQRFATSLFVGNDSEPLSPNEWIKVTREDFDNFKMSPQAHMKVAIPPSIKRNPVMDFKRSIKRDKTHYKEFKDDRYWDSWHRSFVITAKAHDLEHVLNSKYVPFTDDDKELFEEKKKFAYSVMEHVLLTDMGKTIVRKHVHTMDAQTVYKELLQHYQESTAAKQHSSGLLSYVTSTKYNSDWRGTATSFILHWNSQVDQINTLTPEESDKISGNMRKQLMENAVSLVPELRQVKTTADIDAARGGKLLTWEGYYSLLLSAATSYDISKGHAVKGNRGFRRVNMHDMDVIDSTDDTSMDMSIDMSPTDFLEINTAKRPPLTPTKKTPPRTPAMSPAACLQLLKTQRIEDNVWKLLPLDVKQFLSAIFRIRRDSSQGSPMSINTQQQMDISQIDYDDQDMESEEVTPPPNVTSESDGGSPTVDD